jgi:sphinganine C4-monooxygenase
MFFHFIDSYKLAERYRLHPPAELLAKNRCSMVEVIRAVVLQHIVQTVTGIIVMQFEPPQYTGHEAYEAWMLSQRLGVSPAVGNFIYYYGITAFKVAAGLFIIDTWQYALHRAMHMNKWLYRHFHSVHHRLYIPYAFGALYNSLFEGFLLDTCGAGVAYFLTGMTPRESIILYVFSTLKTVDDHCGYELPWDPLQFLFPNNAPYHDIHHQSFGIKSNFSQPFFVHWDVLFSTRYKDTDNYIKKHREQREKLFADSKAKKDL